MQDSFLSDIMDNSKRHNKFLMSLTKKQKARDVMGKYFNVNGNCIPKIHYMVDLTERLRQVRAMVDAGQYFTINRARQYGKTTLLKALAGDLQEDYVVVWLDFQKMSYANFESEQAFVMAFAGELIDNVENLPAEIKAKLDEFAEGNAGNPTLLSMFRVINRWCRQSEKGIVLMIDEVDSATNNQVFLDFLAQLRGGYISRDMKPTFQSVILTGVCDVRNIKRKIRPDEAHKTNSPWNIAAEFSVDMSFSKKDIAGMLKEYEADHKTGMDIVEIAGLLYDYTSGYPFLVSRLCKLLDERIPDSEQFSAKRDAWTRKGVLEAVRILLGEPNPLFESLLNKLEDYPELDRMLYGLLFCGKEIAYVVGVRSIETALMFGFVKRVSNTVIIANRIFETLLYNLYLTSPTVQQDEIYNAGMKNKNQFIKNGRLDMTLVLEKFVMHFDDLYGGQGQTFLEEEGRRYFLLYLRPIINGAGNYYIEARTRNMERTDVIVDYQGERFVVELKIWRGNEYHTRGEAQLLEYLNHYHLDRGYMLSFNFNKNKRIGVNRVVIGDKVLIEAVV